MERSTRSGSVRLVGETARAVDHATLEGLPAREISAEIVCSSGDRYRDSWRGPPIDRLIERVEVPVETTHLTVTATDGFRVCIGAIDALEGVLATHQGGQRLSVDDGYPRFVVAGLEGPRTVKNVAEIGTLALAPGEDPEAHEELRLDRGDRSL